MKKERIALTPKEMSELEELGVDTSNATLAFYIHELKDDGSGDCKPQYRLTTMKNVLPKHIFYCPTFTLSDIMTAIESYNILDTLENHYEVTFKKTHEFDVGTDTLSESLCVAKYEYGELFDRGENGKSHTETADSMVEAAFKLLVWIVNEYNTKVKSELK